jgi:hypothetical protein
MFAEPEKSKRDIPAKMNQQEATRAGAVSWLRAGHTLKEIMSNGKFNKNHCLRW